MVHAPGSVRLGKHNAMDNSPKIVAPGGIGATQETSASGKHVSKAFALGTVHRNKRRARRTKRRSGAAMRRGNGKTKPNARDKHVGAACARVNARLVRDASGIRRKHVAVLENG